MFCLFVQLLDFVSTYLSAVLSHECLSMRPFIIPSSGWPCLPQLLTLISEAGRLKSFPMSKRLQQAQWLIATIVSFERCVRTPHVDPSPAVPDDTLCIFHSVAYMHLSP
jgi:hypothetical protein